MLSSYIVCLAYMAVASATYVLPHGGHLGHKSGGVHCPGGICKHKCVGSYCGTHNKCLGGKCGYPIGIHSIGNSMSSFYRTQGPGSHGSGSHIYPSYSQVNTGILTSGGRSAGSIGTHGAYTSHTVKPYSINQYGPYNMNPFGSYDTTSYEDYDGSYNTNQYGSYDVKPIVSYSTNPYGSYTTIPHGSYSTIPHGSYSTNPYGSYSTITQGSYSTNPFGSYSTIPQGSYSTNPFGSYSTTQYGLYDKKPVHVALGGGQTNIGISSALNARTTGYSVPKAHASY
ncbi:uncharacterized protein [Argopecten irradians]|uniref:uncharacterized protein n=1 Tax=Argopecten irradians TaxID=31199 RepID=UPI00371C6BBF